MATLFGRHDVISNNWHNIQIKKLKYRIGNNITENRASFFKNMRLENVVPFNRKKMS